MAYAFFRDTCIMANFFKKEDQSSYFWEANGQLKAVTWCLGRCLIWQRNTMAICFIQSTGFTERATQQSMFRENFFFDCNFFYVFCRDYSTDNLKYLTTEAALEDVAHFIAYQKSLDEFKDSKVS